MKSYSILIVDDNPDNLETIINLLQESELDVRILKAPNGKIACKLAEKKIPDLIITDWEMPEMNGIETIKHLKSNKSTKDIPVMMCTGVMTETKHLKTALDAGAIDYIRKPIEKIELIARVNSMLKLSESYKKIKLLNSTKDKFFSIIAHDLRGPFNAILGFSEILLNNYKEYDDEKREGMIKIVNNSAVRAFKLLENLLTWARSHSGTIPYMPEKLNLKNTTVQAIYNLKTMADKKEIGITELIHKNELIFADKNMIATVLRNLISNAIKFTHKGGNILISSKKQEESDFIEISVEDTGVGIPKDKIEDLFRIDKNTSAQGTENETGTGLGLILCKEFIEIHGGEIWVESEIGKGSKFIFSIPSKI